MNGVRLVKSFSLSLVFLMLLGVLIPACNSDDDSGGGSKLTSELTEKERGYLTEEEYSTATAMSSEELATEGADQLRTQTSQGVLKASAYFKMADQKDSDDTTRFFRAVSSVAALGFDIESDETGDGLQDFGDLIEALGGTVTTGAWETMEISLPETLPDTAPGIADFLNFYERVVVSRMESAITLLDGITPQFDHAWTEPISNTSVESDYGDVLFSKATLKASLGYFYYLNAYNLNANYKNIDDNTTTEQFLAANPDLLKLKSSESLDRAKAYFIQTADDALEAINWMQMETDPQENDLICLCDVTEEEINNAKSVIADARNSLQTGSAFIVADEDTVMLDLSALFDSLNLRGFLPAFSGDEAVGFWPDPTFGGILVSINGVAPELTINEDLDGNNTADNLED